MRPRPLALLAGLAIAALAIVASPCPLAFAFPPSVAERLDGDLYKPTEKLVAALLEDEGLSSKLDEDNDLEVTFKAGDTDVPGWLVFDRYDDGTIWNLRFTATVPADAERRDQFHEYSNGWNRDEISMKLYVNDDDELVAEQNMPVEFGINPKEFTENGYRPFIDGLERVLKDLAPGATRPGDDQIADPHDNPGDPIIATDPPARAIGLLEMQDGSLCSASVVARDVILTAAHCLFDDDHHRVTPARFSAGFDRGDYVAAAKIRDVYLPPEFDHERFLNSGDIDGYDYAFMRLNHEVGDETGILPVRVLTDAELDAMETPSGQSFSQVGYGNAESDHPVVRRGCHIERWWEDHTYAHHCGTVPGDSGSPDLVLLNGTYAIVGIESAEVDFKNLKGADMVVAASAFADALQRYIGQ
jgi:protease YdgD